jgi:hypothetical protein
VSQFAFGHAIIVNKGGKEDVNRFQNFFMNGSMSHKPGGTGDTRTYQFAPFGFSGVTVNRSGDGLEATLVFPNNDLTRGWALDAIDERYTIQVDVLIIEDTDPVTGPAATHTVVHTYFGQVTGGQWDQVSLNLELSSVLDAVGTDVPMRSLTKKLIGNLPVSNSVRLQ